MKLIESKKPTGDELMLRDVFMRYYFSSILAIICSCIGSIVGNIVVGNALGEDKLGVIALVQPIYYVFATVGNLMGIGGSTLCAGLMGKRRMNDVKKALTVTYIVNTALCLFFTALFLIFLPQAVNLLGTPKALYSEVYDYALVMIIGGIFTSSIYLSFNFLRLDGKAVATTLTFAIMASVTVILDIVLAPLGVLGISIAQSAGAAAATVFGILLICKKSTDLGFCKIKKRELIPFAEKIISTGSPGATENASILIKSYVFNILIVSLLSSSALSSLSVINSVNSFSMAFTVGCAGAIVPLVGVFSAEKDTVSIRKMMNGAVTLSLLFTLAFTLVTALFAPFIADVFGITEGAEETAQAIRLFALSLPVALFANIIIYYHLADGHTVIANILTALHWFVLAVGCAFVMIKGLGNTGFWLSFFMCEVLTVGSAEISHIIVRRKNRALSPILLLDTKYEKKGRIFDISVNDTDVEISKAIEALSEFCEANDMSPRDTMLISLSIDEMCHMAAEHSTRNSKHHTISIRLLLHPGVRIIRLRYQGEMFNPIEYYESKKTDSDDIDAMLELADCLGMKMITDSCDVVDYRETFGINNLTVIL